jgi:diketogulonate reductase-like aldo/keto reductase
VVQKLLAVKRSFGRNDDVSKASRHNFGVPLMPQTAAIPTRRFGRNDVQISVLGFGGHDLGDAEDENAAIRLVREAVDGGITFFDNCWEYHRGKTEDWMGKALKGLRDRVFLMTKVCTHGRDKDLALRMA